MAGKAASMTPAQIREAGYAVVRVGGIGAGPRYKAWRVMRLDSGGSGHFFVLGNYESRISAVSALKEELTPPDGTLRPAEPRPQRVSVTPQRGA